MLSSICVVLIELKEANPVSAVDAWAAVLNSVCVAPIELLTEANPASAVDDEE